MMNADALIKFCRRLLPFSALSDEDLANIISASQTRFYQAKDYVFFEGSTGEAGYVVLSGRVAMVKSSSSGREMIMELLPAGEFFGVVVLLENRPFPLSARAQSNADILVIPRAAIANIANSNPHIFQGFLNVVSQRLQTAHNVARSLAHDKVEVRIASALLALVERDVASIQIGRQELADLTGTTIETASRICKLWERDGVIGLPSLGMIDVLDRESLQAILRNSE